MYASLLNLNLGPGMRSAGEQLADQSNPTLKTRKGFKGITFFADVEAGEYMSLGLWETKEDAEASAAISDPKLKEAVGNILKKPPTRRFFEVYKPKA
jgi:heme-degrading monooxygenase HmoA